MRIAPAAMTAILMAAPAAAQESDDLTRVLDTLAVLWTRGDAVALASHGAEMGLDLDDADWDSIVELNLPSSTGGAASDDVPFTIEVIVRESGFEITNGRLLIASIDKVEGDYDLQALSDHMLALKQDHPDHEAASVLLEPQIPYDYLIQVMDVVRSVEVPGDGEQESLRAALFPDISIGEAP